MAATPDDGYAEGGREPAGPPGPGDADSREHEALRDRHVEETFERALSEGRRRLSRRWLPLAATGFVGGIDVGTGVLALLLVEHAMGGSLTGRLLSGLAFGTGFIALTLARSELFTENFLVPVTTVIARQSTVARLLRMWSVTFVANLAGGWVVTALIIAGYPELRTTAVETGARYVALGLGWRAFALALLGGIVMTLMTWMQHSFESPAAKIVPAVTAAFLLVGGGLDHAVVNSLLLFAGLHTGQAPYDYLSWVETAGWATLGNIVGGIGLVTILRLLQVPHRVQAQRGRPAPSVADRAARRSQRGIG